MKKRIKNYAKGIPGVKIARFQNYKIAELQDFKIARLQDYKISRLKNKSQITNITS